MFKAPGYVLRGIVQVHAQTLHMTIRPVARKQAVLVVEHVGKIHLNPAQRRRQLESPGPCIQSASNAQNRADRMDRKCFSQQIIEEARAHCHAEAKDHRP